MGTVLDASGASIPNASVNITNLGTGETRNATSGGTGEFVFSVLPSGHYSVRVASQGFKGFVLPDLALSAGDRARVEIGQASQT